MKNIKKEGKNSSDLVKIFHLIIWDGRKENAKRLWRVAEWFDPQTVQIYPFDILSDRGNNEGLNGSSGKKITYIEWCSETLILFQPGAMFSGRVAFST